MSQLTNFITKLFKRRSYIYPAHRELIKCGDCLFYQRCSGPWPSLCLKKYRLAGSCRANDDLCGPTAKLFDPKQGE